MSRIAGTGPRIRARRMERGITQNRLARTVGISASYLNLIEHGRRRIGGRLLGDLARALGTPAGALADGPDAALRDALARVAAGHDGAAADPDRAANLAEAFPDWAALAVAQHERIGTLERAIERLEDRARHDPTIPAAVHEILTKVTAIRSSAGILAEGGVLPAKWQARFHRNIDEDSRALATIAQDLAGHLGATGSDGRVVETPQDAFEGWLAARDYHLPEVETGAVVEAPDLDGGARALLAAHEDRARRDATRLPLPALADALGRVGVDPLGLAAALGCGADLVMRRLASAPRALAGGPVGIAVADGAGALTFRRPVEGFEMPRGGPGCPLWPLYQAMQLPMPLALVIEQPRRAARPVAAWAVARRSQPLGHAGPVCVEATMLVVPLDLVAAPPPRSATAVGSQCRVCEIAGCPVRRQPSILSGSSAAL